MSSAHWHPTWCGLRFCTAYAPEDLVERRCHRTDPIIIPSDDQSVAYYLHIGSEPDGTDPRVEITEPASPNGPWWHPAEQPTAELIMSLERADQFRCAVAVLLAAVAPMPAASVGHAA